jgi:hypothetical protein
MLFVNFRDIFAALVTLSLVGVAQATTEANSLQSLTLKILVDQKEILPLEPVQVTLSLANETDTAILARTIFSHSVGGPLQVFIAAGDGPFQTFDPSDWPIVDYLTNPKGTTFAPGWKDTVSAVLYDTRSGDPDKTDQPWRFVLPNPGTWRVKATLKDLDGKQQIESNIVTFKAVEPVGEDAQAYAFLKGLQNRKDKDERGRHVSYSGFLTSSYLPHVETLQEEFLAKFPNSRYARYLYYTLGRKYSTGQGKGGIQRGLEYLEKAGGYKDFFQAPEALGHLVKACAKQKDIEQAKRHLATLQKEYPDSPSARYAAYYVHQASN